MAEHKWCRKRTFRSRRSLKLYLLYRTIWGNLLFRLMSALLFVHGAGHLRSLLITILIWLMTCACLLCSRATETFLNHNSGNIEINKCIININIIHNIHITFKLIFKSSYALLLAIHTCVNMHLLIYISGESVYLKESCRGFKTMIHWFSAFNINISI